MLPIIVLLLLIYIRLIYNIYKYLKNHNDIITKDISKDFKLHMNWHLVLIIWIIFISTLFFIVDIIRIIFSYYPETIIEKICFIGKIMCMFIFILTIKHLKDEEKERHLIFKI